MHIDVEPATSDQVVQVGNDWVVVEKDVGEVAKELQEIDDRLHIRNNPRVGIYAVFAKENNEEYLVFTAKSIDKRICNRIRKIMSSGYDYVKELEKVRNDKDKEFEYKQDQIIGEKAEELAFRIRKDLGMTNNRIFVGRNS